MDYMCMCMLPVLCMLMRLFAIVSCRSLFLELLSVWVLHGIYHLSKFSKQCDRVGSVRFFTRVPDGSIYSIFPRYSPYILPYIPPYMHLLRVTILTAPPVLLFWIFRWLGAVIMTACCTLVHCSVVQGAEDLTEWCLGVLWRYTCIH